MKSIFEKFKAVCPKGMKKGTKRIGGNIRNMAASIALCAAFALPKVASASNGYMTELNNIPDFLYAILSVVGVVLTIYGAISFILALRKTDQGQEYMGVFCIVSGICLFNLENILSALGVKL